MHVNEPVYLHTTLIHKHVFAPNTYSIEEDMRSESQPLFTLKINNLSVNRKILIFSGRRGWVNKKRNYLNVVNLLSLK